MFTCARLFSVHSFFCEEESPPLRSTPQGAYRWSHLLPDQISGEHTGGATSSLINSLGRVQVEPPPPRSTPWGTYRWSHLLPDQLTGEHTGGMAAILVFLFQYNYLSKNTHCLCIHLIALSTILQSGRGMVVGHVLMVHKFSFMYTNHIGIIVHIPGFLQVGEHSGLVAFSHAMVLLQR